MTQFTFASGGDNSIQELVTALGLEDVPGLRRIVIDIGVDRIVNVYTDQLIEEADFGEFINTLMKHKPKRIKTNVHSGS